MDRFIRRANSSAIAQAVQLGAEFRGSAATGAGSAAHAIFLLLDGIIGQDPPICVLKGDCAANQSAQRSSNILQAPRLKRGASQCPVNLFRLLKDTILLGENGAV